MRSVLVVLFIILFLILTLPLLLIEFIIGLFSPKIKARSSLRVLKGFSRIVLFLSGTSYEIIGRERVPSDIDTGVLYAANHRSYFDIPLFILATPTLSGMVSKKEMAKIPIIPLWMKNINCLFLDRDNIREGLKTILKGVEYIKDGHSMYIAPEGSRNQGKEMLPFKEGSFKMAEKAKAPIIPVSFINTDAIYENHTPWVKAAHVVIEFGHPIYIEDLDKEDRKFIGSHVRKIIGETLDKHSMS